jgi:hypothetical protein
LLRVGSTYWELKGCGFSDIQLVLILRTKSVRKGREMRLGWKALRDSSREDLQTGWLNGCSFYGASAGVTSAAATETMAPLFGNRRAAIVDWVERAGVNRSGHEIQLLGRRWLMKD